MKLVQFPAILLLLILHVVHGESATPPPPRLSSGKFWQLTDLHMDEMYDESNGVISSWCQTARDGEKGERLHRYGEYPCDAPWELVKSSIQQMSKLYPEPDFIIWNGDSTTHAKDPKTNQSVDTQVVYSTERQIVSILRGFFPKVPILAVLGNHDTFPPDFFPDTNDAPTDFYREFLVNSNWASLMPYKQQLQFMNCGFYKRSDIIPGKTFLLLNTNLYYKTNNTASDPCGQFYWLKKQLKAAQNNSVFIIGHVPPGFYERNGFGPYMRTKSGNSVYNFEFASIITDYGHKIYAQIYGHTHTDTLRLFTKSYKNWKEGATSAALIAPSVTPLVESETSTNPTVRHYEYDDISLIDYQQFYMQLYEGVWHLEYRFTDTYGVPDLSLDSMKVVFEKLIDDIGIFETYYKHNTALHKEEPCGLDCRQIHLCGMSNVYTDEFYACLKDYKLMKAERKSLLKSALPILNRDVQIVEILINNFYASMMHFIVFMLGGILIVIMYMCCCRPEKEIQNGYELIQA